MNALLAFALLLAPEARADQKEAETCGRVAMWEAFTTGGYTHAMRVANVEPGGSRHFQVTLQRGNEYTLVGCGDGAVSNVDVMVYDRDGHVVARSYGEGSLSSVVFAPAATAPYFVAVYASDGARRPTGGASHVALAVSYR